MGRTILLTTAVAIALSAQAAAQTIEKVRLVTISAPVIGGGIISEIVWDGDTVVLQAAVADSDGRLSARYYSVAGPGSDLLPVPGVSTAAKQYWERKASRVSPSGHAQITPRNDAKMPMYGVGPLEKRLLDAQDMGGTDVTYELLLGKTTIHSGRTERYDGEVWSWSPAELNRIAYVDGKGDLWIAHADGGGAQRIAKGSFTLPAWSDDGRTLAVVERKNGGARWDVWVLHLPEKLRN